jgi:nucleoside 2-deoxyribosyltransferase/SAM-dependent methyltransferase
MVRIPKIYWANAMFSEADREFNRKCADILRKAGYQVFLPQEAAVNRETSPSPRDIFRVDTSEILQSDVLIACIDQETIDCGVACEIGIAFAYGIPIIGLYTDIRQYRKGPGRMYKNPYVLGAIEAIGEIVSSVEELLQVIPKHIRNPRSSTRTSERAIIRHFDSIAPRYSEFITRLESWYDPPWRVEHLLDRWFQAILPKRVIEFGCGGGDLARHLSDRYTGIFYVGYDRSRRMIQLARSRSSNPACIFTTSWSKVEKYAKQEPFDVALALFTLHDHPNPEKAVSLLGECLRTAGILLIVDLSTWDLPRLTDLLRRTLARPMSLHDGRFDPVKLNQLAKATGFTIIDCSIIMPFMHFPTFDDLSEYLEIFGIYKGMDLPLDLSSSKASVTCQLVAKALSGQNYPFTDQRCFIACAFKKQK